jgi:hypothetical protein
MVDAFVLAVTLAISAINTADAEPQRFTLSSPAFNDNAMLPLKYTGGALCGSDSRGGNFSPPLAWSSPPPGTRTLANVRRSGEPEQNAERRLLPSDGETKFSLCWCSAVQAPRGGARTFLFQNAMFRQRRSAARTTTA